MSQFRGRLQIPAIQDELKKLAMSCGLEGGGKRQFVDIAIHSAEAVVAARDPDPYVITGFIG